jgi:hypothetical protein
MESAGPRYLLIEVATGAGVAQQAWDDNVPDGLTQREGAPDQPGVYVPLEEVDLETHAIVVVSSGTSSSCPAWPEDVRLTDSHVEVDLAADVGADAACTDDLAPYRAVLAVERDRLPTTDALPIETLLMRLMGEVHRHYRQDPLFRVELSFLLGTGDPRLLAALAHRQATFYEAADQAWQALLDTYGRSMREPFAVRDLSRVMAAQVVGSVVIWFSDPDILRDPLGEEGASLMSRAMVAIFNQLTVSADGEAGSATRRRP